MEIFNEELMNPLFSIFEKTKGVEQGDINHPEGDVFTHSLQVVKWAFRESNDTDLILAALLHDVGKAINVKGHDRIGADVLEPFVSTKTRWLVEQHMRIWPLILGDMQKLSKVLELANHPWLPELVMLARWDKKGRNPRAKTSYDRTAITDRLNKCVINHFCREEQP